MSVVLFAFGVTETRAGAGLPGPFLLRLLADLGLSPSAARSILLRMRRDGLLTATHVGRVAHYALTPALGALEDRLENQLRGKRPAWDGTFHGLLYEVPETQRSFRDRLRYAAQLAGYAPLRPGLLIAPTDRSTELAELLNHTPPRTEVLTPRIELSLPEARRVATRIWNLEGLAENYRTVIATATAATQAHAANPPTGREAFQALAETLQPVYAAAGDDPDLPTELLPADWPGERLGQTIGIALRALGPAVGVYLEALRQEHGRETHTDDNRKTS